ncbi:hypothetical protein NL676_003622 [Syzygium grande]|nr:hypothetical protein NL676_003622 [Syzygium grande]
MANNKVLATVFFGGKFQVGPPLKYIGGTVNVVEIDVSTRSLSNITRVIEALGGCKIEKLYHRVPTSSVVENYLRYLWDNSVVIDLFYDHVYSEIIELYVEYVNDEETFAEIENEGLYDVDVERVHNVTCIVFENVIGNLDDMNWVEVGDRDLDENKDASNVFKNVIRNTDNDGNRVEVSIRDLDEDDDNVCNLVDVEHLSDNDHLELIEARAKLKEHSMMHRLITGVNIEAAGTSQSDVNLPSELVAYRQFVNDSGYETEYYNSDKEESLHLSSNDEGEEEEDVVLSRRGSRFPSYIIQNDRNPIFIIGMTFEDAAEFKDAILRYSVVEQRPCFHFRLARSRLPCSSLDRSCFHFRLALASASLPLLAPRSLFLPLASFSSINPTVARSSSSSSSSVASSSTMLKGHLTLIAPSHTNLLRLLLPPDLPCAIMRRPRSSRSFDATAAGRPTSMCFVSSRPTLGNAFGCS